MNFLQITIISGDSVALNIMTCFCVGVARKISCTARRISVPRINNFANGLKKRPHTYLIQHLVAFIKNEHFQVP